MEVGDGAGERLVARDPLSDRFLIDHALRSAAASRAEHAAIVFEGRRVSYQELDVLVDRAAAALRARGVRRGDRVLVALDNCVETAALFYGALRADAIPSLLGAAIRPRRLAKLVAIAEPSAVVLDARSLEGATGAIGAASACSVLSLGAAERPSGVEDFGEALSTVAHEAPARMSIELDLATICWTSGSTGEPKGVMLTHQNLRNSVAAIGAYLEHGPEDVLLCVLPLSHTYGLFQMLVAHATGGTLVLERGFSMPFPIVQRMVEHRVTGFAGVPTIFASLLSLKNLGAQDLSSLRYVTNAAYGLPAAQVDRLRAALPHVRFFAMYGQTECTRVCYLPPGEATSRAGSVGISMPNQEAWIEREDGTRAAPGEVGELVVRGANVMRGYFRDPEATARALRPGAVPGEVVLHTNDLFRMDDAGYLHFVARRDDVIKTRGEKVSPLEVEGAIARLPGVVEVAVAGVPDPVLGAAVKAFVVAAAGATVTADDVRRIVRAELDETCVPKLVDFVTALPRTGSGKVKKGELV